MAENGPLEFRTVLYSNYDEKLGNHERKTFSQSVFAVNRSIRCILACHMLKTAENCIALSFGHSM